MLATANSYSGLFGGDIDRHRKTAKVNILSNSCYFDIFNKNTALLSKGGEKVLCMVVCGCRSEDRVKMMKGRGWRFAYRIDAQYENSKDCF